MRSRPPQGPRARSGLPVFWTYTSNGEQSTRIDPGWTRNLSETGPVWHCENPWPPSARPHLILQTEGDNLAGVWIAHPGLPGSRTLHGVSFPQVPPEQRQPLRALLRCQRASRPQVACQSPQK